jgi:RimJ/RimL family protein N-acetyltransferase
MKQDIALRRLDEPGLHRLLEVAVADAEPDETMPPMPGEQGWSEARRQYFLAFFGPMLGSLETIIYAITVGGETAGFMRLKRIDQPGTAETGMWLGRSYRGKGIGAAALQVLLREAARHGYQRMVADTTPGNLAAQGVLRHNRATTRAGDGKIYAEIAIGPAYADDL